MQYFIYLCVCARKDVSRDPLAPAPEWILHITLIARHIPAFRDRVVYTSSRSLALGNKYDKSQAMFRVRVRRADKQIADNE